MHVVCMVYFVIIDMYIAGIVPLYCETLFRQTDEKKAAGGKEEYEVCLFFQPLIYRGIT